MKPIIRRLYHGMNKTEMRYAQQLALLENTGEIVGWKFEPMRLILSHNIYGARNATSYCPDFMVVYKDRFVFVDVKAKNKRWTSMRDDARAKINIASEMFPWFEFKVAYLERGQWTEKGV